MTGFIFAVLVTLTMSTLCARIVQSLIRQHARERDLLLNQIMHLSGKTWTPPPAHEEREAPEPRVTVRSPEQYPDEALA